MNVVKRRTKVKGTNHREGITAEGPVIFRTISYDLVEAIVVYVAKKGGYKTIEPDLMLTVIYVLSRLCKEGDP